MLMTVQNRDDDTGIADPVATNRDYADHKNTHTTFEWNMIIDLR